MFHRLGRVVDAAADLPWASTHAALATVEVLEDRWRITCSGRDDEGRSRIGLVDLRRESPHDVIERHDEPLLTAGVLGAFDDRGVTHSCRLVHDGIVHLYYTGWSLGVTVPFYFYIGEAVSIDGGRTFERRSSAPLLDRNAVDPFLTASPWVVVEGGLWRMWYVSCVGWDESPGGPRHRYLVKYAESTDGENWERSGGVAVGFLDESEYAISRPFVMREADGYRMWFSVRGDSYRIACATSSDGLDWRRVEAPEGSAPAPSGWDTEMTAYPVVFEDHGRTFVLYNGNGYGRSGLGLAELLVA